MFERLLRAAMCLSVLGVMLAPGGAAAQTFARYENGRFQYALDYPADLVKQPPPTNNDGRKFISHGGRVELVAWGRYNALEQTLKQVMADAFEEHRNDKIAYHIVKHDYFVLSGFAGDMVFYEATVRYRPAKEVIDAYASFTFTYPKTMKANYDPMVGRMLKSLLASVR